MGCLLSFACPLTPLSVVAVYCAQEQELDINQIPVLTEAIVSEVKKLLDVAESLTRDSTYDFFWAVADSLIICLLFKSIPRTGSMDQRQNLLLALARLVSWADKCYMSEDRSNTSTDPSSYLGKLSTAVKVSPTMQMSSRGS